MPVTDRLFFSAFFVGPFSTAARGKGLFSRSAFPGYLVGVKAPHEKVKTQRCSTNRQWEMGCKVVRGLRWEAWGIMCI